MTYRLNLFLLALAAFAGLPFYWLLLANPLRNAPPQPIDIAQLRQLAASLPGQKPTGIGFISLGWKRVPGNFYAAGSGMKRRLLGVISYRLEVPGKGPVVIDSGTTGSLAQALDMERFQPDKQAIVDGWIRQASLILATSERPLHLGGLAAAAGRPGGTATLSHARLNRAQLPDAARQAGVAWPAGLALRPAKRARSPYAVAPGIVVIPTGVPSPGSQMIYVRLANRREYVFTGDLAPFHVNHSELRVRSNLLDWNEPEGQRAAMMRWLSGLRRLSRAAPGLTVLPAHDFDWLIDEAGRTRVIPAG